MSTPTTSPAVAELLERWRRLTAGERAAFLVTAWRERWPVPAPPAAAEPEAP